MTQNRKIIVGVAVALAGLAYYYYHRATVKTANTLWNVYLKLAGPVGGEALIATVTYTEALAFYNSDPSNYRLSLA